MNRYDPIISDHYLKNIIFNLHSFEGFGKYSNREISVMDYSERNGDGMTIDELYMILTDSS